MPKMGIFPIDSPEIPAIIKIVTEWEGATHVWIFRCENRYHYRAMYDSPWGPMLFNRAAPTNYPYPSQNPSESS